MAITEIRIPTLLASLKYVPTGHSGVRNIFSFSYFEFTVYNPVAGYVSPIELSSKGFRGLHFYLTLHGVSAFAEIVAATEELLRR